MNTETPNIRAVRAVRPGQGRELMIVWMGGVESVVDVTGHLAAWAVYAPLRDDEAFAAVSVGEGGWSVHWSDDMEISSDTLWRLGLEQGYRAMAADGPREAVAQAWSQALIADAAGDGR
ncbi:MAG TPA: DUF2442 domain-containing protein [Caulobacteraceae bacterium]|nr:DUF2442 domain-containing protein [Caulobacteraceae bacterium]